MINSDICLIKNPHPLVFYIIVINLSLFFNLKLGLFTYSTHKLDLKLN
jgi:hypothetical protein